MQALLNNETKSLISWGILKTQGWSGIEIIPYQQNLRMARFYMDWYYPWDCACGAIWDAENIVFDEEVIFSFDQEDSKELVREVMAMPDPEGELTNKINE